MSVSNPVTFSTTPPFHWKNNSIFLQEELEKCENRLANAKKWQEMVTDTINQLQNNRIVPQTELNNLLEEHPEIVQLQRDLMKLTQDLQLLLTKIGEEKNDIYLLNISISMEKDPRKSTSLKTELEKSKNILEYLENSANRVVTDIKNIQNHLLEEKNDKGITFIESKINPNNTLKNENAGLLQAVKRVQFFEDKYSALKNQLCENRSKSKATRTTSRVRTIAATMATTIGGLIFYHRKQNKKPTTIEGIAFEALKEETDSLEDFYL